MQDTVDLPTLIKNHPELPYAALAVVSYTISIFFGIMEVGDAVDFYGVKIHPISTTLWAVFGLASLYLLYTAFFDMWIYAIHLIFAYILAGAGFIGLFIFYEETAIMIFSIALIIMSVAFIYYFIYRIGNIRTFRILNSPDPEDARDRYSLQSWYLVPFFFFAITAISFIDLAHWYDNSGHTPVVHIAAEIVLIITVVYLLWKPENVLFYGTKEYGTTLPAQFFTEGDGGSGGQESRGSDAYMKPITGGEGSSGTGLKQSIETRVKRKKSIANCPGFDVPPTSLRKTCPSCHSTNTFDWCPPSEEYLISCPTCREMTFFGRKVCVHCKSRLVEKVACTNCGKQYPIRRFKDV